MANPEFPLREPVLPERPHHSPMLLLKLLGVSLQMDLDSNDMAARTANGRILLLQVYVALNTIQLIPLIDNPLVISTVNDL